MFMVYVIPGVDYSGLQMGVKYSEGLSTLAPKTWLIFSIMAGLYIYIYG